jgi:hypothetical protein
MPFLSGLFKSQGDGNTGIAWRNKNAPVFDWGFLGISRNSLCSRNNYSLTQVSRYRAS